MGVGNQGFRERAGFGNTEGKKKDILCRGDSISNSGKLQCIFSSGRSEAREEDEEKQESDMRH